MPRDKSIKPRRGAAATWATAEASAAVLADGELGFVTDTKDLVVGDGTTKVASLPRVGGSALAVQASTTTLTGTLVAGQLLPVDTTAGVAAYTLPAASAVASGRQVAVKNAAAVPNVITVTRAGSDLIYGVAAGGTTKTLSLSGEVATFQSDGVSKWTVISSDTPSAALSATFAPVAILGSRWVALGDSTTYALDTPSTDSRGASWTTYASTNSGQRLHLVYNAGVAGNTTAQMLARFDTDVTPYAPKMVSILGGRNDIGGAVPLATFQANILALIAKCRSIGATPVLCTITPTTSTAGVTTRVWNAWLRSYAAAAGIRIIDFYRVLVDPATGSYLAAYNSGDAIHPSEAGYAAMGALFWSDLTPFALPACVPRLEDKIDENNLLSGRNPLFLTATLTSNAPSSWNVTDAGSVLTGSFITNDATIQGNWYRGTYATSANDVTITIGAGIQAVAGRKYAFTGRIRTNLSASGGNLGVQVRINRGDGVSSYPLAVNGLNAVDGRFWSSFVAQSGAVTVPGFIVKAGATGTVDLAEIALYDLTALGIDTLVA